VTHSQPADAQDQRAAALRANVAEIAVMARETGAETGRPRFSDAVMAAWGKSRAHRFVPALQDVFAYDNRPLADREGQTISQPYIVALMTDLLDPKRRITVLRGRNGLGLPGGSARRAGAKVYTIEIVEALGLRASRFSRARVPPTSRCASARLRRAGPPPRPSTPSRHSGARGGTAAADRPASSPADEW